MTTDNQTVGLDVGLAGHYIWEVMPSADAYVGVDVGVDHLWTKSEGKMGSVGTSRETHKFRTTLWRAGPVVGGEYRFSEVFSLGVEAGFEANYFSAKTETEGAENDPADTGWSLGTRASLVARFVF